MTITDLVALAPFILPAAGSIVILLLIAFRRGHLVTLVLTVAALAAGLLALPAAAGLGGWQATPLIVVDGFAVFFTGFLYLAAAFVALLAYTYLRAQDWRREEFYVLLLIATVGAAVLAASNHFVSFFLGLEILSVSLYSLIGYARVREEGVEAGIKYLILAATSAAFLLFGMALIYADTGSMEFARIAATSNTSVIYLAGTALLIVGIGYKLALVPFHLWAPDVYQGSPAPTTAFIATLSKGGMVAVLLRYFSQVGLEIGSPIFIVFAVIAVLSMFAGNLLALLQNNVKRLLAYSSISHLGYILVAFLAGGELAAGAATFYVVAYAVTLLTAFGVVGVLSDGEGEAERIDDYRGLFWRRPWLAIIFTAALLSLAGIPLTGGFIGKFFVAAAGISSALWWLVVALMVASTIGLVYYLRLAATMYMQPAEVPATRNIRFTFYSAAGLALVSLAALLLVLGIYPTPLVSILQAMVAGLV